MRGRQMIFRKVYHCSLCKSLLKVLGILLLLCMLALCLCACTETAPPEAESFAVQYTAGIGGKIEGIAHQTVFAGENSETVKAIPDDGYIFVKWSDGVTEDMRTDRQVSADISVTAIFKIAYTVEYTAGEHGKIEGETNQQIAYLKSGTTVTAVPDEGYIFVRWSDGNTNAERTERYVTEAVNVSAIFVKGYRVTYQTEGEGKIVGLTQQTVGEGYSSAWVTAQPSKGYIFAKWSDGKTEAIRYEQDVRADISLTAIFVKYQEYSVEYRVNDYNLGDIYYKNQNKGGGYFARVYTGYDGPTVTAKPKEGYAFIAWSDGVETPERQDLRIISDIRVEALFGYIINYEVDGNEGGKLVGELTQSILPDGKGTQVTAVPDEGYVFSGWSDVNLQVDRQDTATKNDRLVAYFEPIEKSFQYYYGVAHGTPTAARVTINRNAIKEAEFVVPQAEGYTFKGWYASSDYKLKVVNEYGLYMLGYYGFTLETDTLYARWQKDGEEEGCTHKILFVMVDSVQATLYPKKAEQGIEVNYKMSAIERYFCALPPDKMQTILNEWFEGITSFEIDSYYTLETLNRNNIWGDKGDHNIWANNIPEVYGLLQYYHNVLTVFGLNDWEHVLIKGAGAGQCKFASVYLDDRLYMLNPNLSIVEQYYDAKDKLLDSFTIVCLHEFTHTVELSEEVPPPVTYHATYNPARGGYDTKNYLLGQYNHNGEMVGIPRSYWKHEIYVCVGYSEAGSGYGHIEILDGDYYFTNGTSGRLFVKYGSDLTVKAVSENAAKFRFVRWRDGTKTEVYRITNIISYYEIYPIFEVIK